MFPHPRELHPQPRRHAIELLCLNLMVQIRFAMANLSFIME